MRWLVETLASWLLSFPTFPIICSMSSSSCWTQRMMVFCVSLLAWKCPVWPQKHGSPMYGLLCTYTTVRRCLHRKNVDMSIALSKSSVFWNQIAISCMGEFCRSRLSNPLWQSHACASSTAHFMTCFDNSPMTKMQTACFFACCNQNVSHTNNKSGASGSTNLASYSTKTVKNGEINLANVWSKILFYLCWHSSVLRSHCLRSMSVT